MTEKEKENTFPGWFLKPWIFEKMVGRFKLNIFYSGKSQKKNLMSYFGLIDRRIGPSDKEQPVSGTRTWISTTVNSLISGVWLSKFNLLYPPTDPFSSQGDLAKLPWAFYQQKFVSFFFPKAELLQEGIFFLIHLFARDVVVMKKLEIKKLSPLLLYQF